MIRQAVPPRGNPPLWGTLVSIGDRHGNLMTSKGYADAEDTVPILQIWTDEASAHGLVRLYRRYVDAVTGAQAWRLAGVERYPSARPTWSGGPGGLPEPAPVRMHRFE